MIDKKEIISIVEEYMRDSDLFLVDVSVSADNDIVVEIDADSSVDIDNCCAITRLIEEKLPREPEDYSLEVGSSGLTSPFKLPRQFKKNIGNEIEVAAGGRKLVGTLTDASDSGFAMECEVREKGKKSKQIMEFAYGDIVYAKYNLKFK